MLDVACIILSIIILPIWTYGLVKLITLFFDKEEIVEWDYEEWKSWAINIVHPRMHAKIEEDKEIMKKMECL